MTRARRGRALLVGLGGLAVIAAVPGCTSSATGPTASTPATSSASAPTPTPTEAPTTSTPASTSSSAPASSSASSATTSSASPSVSAVPQSSCKTLTIRVIRGSAAQGYEFAALQFTNIGARSCTLVGYPTVTLLLNGKQIGKPSQPASSVLSQMTLRPGDTAESGLKDYTSCQAPLSDSIRVVVPGSTISAVRPGQLRACNLRVDALGVPD